MIRCNLLSFLLFALGSIAIIAESASAQFSFTPLGMYEATGVSGDGSVIVGYSFPSPRWAYRWTPATGTQPMNFWFVQSSGREVVPLSISDDGSVMVGAFYENIGAQPKAFRWTAEEGLDPFFLNVISTFSIARDVSADGSVIVGDGLFETTGPFFRWTAEAGLTDLRENGAYAVSGDGRVIAGGSYLWTLEDGPFLLPGLASSTSPLVWDLSADGSVAVGNVFYVAPGQTRGSEAFKWMKNGGAVGLGDIPGGSLGSAALAVSADGSVIVGHGATEGELFNVQATFWTDELGIVTLKDYLVSNGVPNLDGWRLVIAKGVSADDRTIIGDGINPQGQAEAWAATIPEATTMGLAAVACIVLGLAVVCRLV